MKHIINRGDKTILDIISDAMMELFSTTSFKPGKGSDRHLPIVLKMLNIALNGQDADDRDPDKDLVMFSSKFGVSADRYITLTEEANPVRGLEELQEIIGEKLTEAKRSFQLTVDQKRARDSKTREDWESSWGSFALS